MKTSTVTTTGQLTLDQDALQHLGIRPGEEIELHKELDGRITLRAAKMVRSTGTMDSFLQGFPGKIDKPLTVDEMNEVIAAAWAGDR